MNPQHMHSEAVFIYECGSAGAPLNVPVCLKTHHAEHAENAE